MTSKQKLYTISLTILTIWSASLYYTFATPPTTPYNVAETLDPTCAPNTPNCYVKIVDANNGLTLSGSNLVQLGGTLVQDTVIDQGGNDFSVKNDGFEFSSSANFGGFGATGMGIIQQSVGAIYPGANELSMVGVMRDPSLAGASYPAMYYSNDLGGLGSLERYVTLGDTSVAMANRLNFSGNDYATQVNLGDDLRIALYSSSLNKTNEINFDNSFNGISFSSELGSYTFPRTDGLANQVLTTDGAGQLSWQNAGGGASGWSLTGNAGTIVGTNFIGTTDAQDFMVKTNGNQIALFGQQGNVAIGSDNTGIDPLLTLPTASNIGSVAFQSGQATGVYSTAFGIGQASGDAAMAFGSGQATNQFSAAWGTPCTSSNPLFAPLASAEAATAWGCDAVIASARAATAFGNGTTASGVRSTAFGVGNFARSENETAFGQYGTDYIPVSASEDRLLNIGNGVFGSLSDTFTILKNGQTGIAIDNFEANTNGNIFQVGDGSTGIIGYVDNGTGNWMAVSDERKKHNITDIQYGLNEILQLKPVSFDYNRNNEHTIGFLAQQVLPIIPEAVSGDETKGYAMSYATLTPALVKAIQELSLKIDTIAPNTSSTTLYDVLKTWLASTTNSITEIAADTFRARKEVCINNTCLNESDIQEFKTWQSAHTTPVVNLSPVVPTPPVVEPTTTGTPSLPDPMADQNPTPEQPPLITN